MTVQLHDGGEEYSIKLEAGIISAATQITFGLFDDSTDSLSDSDGLSAINTEPTDGNYTRQTFSLDDTEFSVTKNANGNYQYTKDEFDWDVGGTTGEVDSYFAIINFEGSDRLVYTGSLDKNLSLQNQDTLSVSSIGRAQD